MHALTLSAPRPGMALLAVDLPGKRANVLSRTVLDELQRYLDVLQQRNDLLGLIICSGKPGTFVAGADLYELAELTDAPREQAVAMCRQGQQLLSRLAELPFVTVAAIDGACLGGGAELALWCDRRVATSHPKTVIGFPEVELGLIPGWGGTVRTPRMIGLTRAAELISTGKPVDTATAAEYGLVTTVAAPQRLVEVACEVIEEEQRSRKYVQDRQRWAGPMPSNPLDEPAVATAASSVRAQQIDGQTSPRAVALQLMLRSTAVDAEAACQMEAEQMADLMTSPLSAALLNVFFLTDRLKKDPAVARAASIKQIQSVGIVGAGMMGSDVAAATTAAGLPVTITDASEEALAKVQQKSAGHDLLKATAVEAELADCDLIVEAVVENLDVKRRVYSRLEPHLRSDAMLSSNTSTIPITRLAEQLQRPDRFCGIHFFAPVSERQLVEIIRGQQTSDETIAAAVAYAKRLGKLPIVVKDGPGFLVNRLLLPYMHEALELVCEGVPLGAIDGAARRFGMPIGPVELFDLIGVDTAFYSGRTMWEAFPERITISPLIIGMVKTNRLGRKTGRGFFLYADEHAPPRQDPELASFLSKYLRASAELTEHQLTMRLFLPMLLEAVRVLQEQIVRDARDVDAGLIYGLGFPRARGGLLFWADQVGLDTIVKWLEPLAQLGPRAQPPPLLLEMVRQGRTFYGKGRDGLSEWDRR